MSQSAGSSPSKLLYTSQIDKNKFVGPAKHPTKSDSKKFPSSPSKSKPPNRPTTSTSPYASNIKNKALTSKHKTQLHFENGGMEENRKGISSQKKHNTVAETERSLKGRSPSPGGRKYATSQVQKRTEILKQNQMNNEAQKNMNDNETSSSFTAECFDVIKRYTYGVPRQNYKAGLCDKENDRRERASGTVSPSKTRNLKKDTKSQRNEDRPTELACKWTFDKDVMWSLNPLNNKRSGYILFNCSNLGKPMLSQTAAKYEMTFRFYQTESKLLRLVLESHGFTEVQHDNFNLFWSNSHFSAHELKPLQEWQKVNHFPRSAELTRKDRLYRNIKQMQRQFGVKLFDFIPTSFALPLEYRDFCDTYLRERGTWIVKPVASSQGKGIYLASQMDQVPTDETVMVCKYIETPLLVNGYKCDLRLYVCVTSLDPLIVYLYEEGLVRLASVKYQQGKELMNPCIHLTNYSVNKHHSDYIQNEDPDIEDRGNKWSLSAFLRHLKARGVDTGTLMRGIEDVILKSLLSASFPMTTATNIFIPHARNCFELYGFDILIDSNLKPWILEVNLSPSLNIDQPLDLKIKSSMLVDLFSLVGVQICNPRTAKYSSKHSVLRKMPNLRYSTETYEKSHFRGRSGSSERYIPSIEEMKMFKQVKEESERRGGWARIFPTPDSWTTYGSFLEYQSPLNLILHHHLYPDVPRSGRILRVAPLRTANVSCKGLASSLERLVCYERSLPKCFSTLKEKFKFGYAKRDEKTMQANVVNLKASLVEAMENGYVFSKYQARMTFSMYLQHVQRRLMIGCDQDKQSEIVYRFLRSATRTLQLPVCVQAPCKTLPKESQAVIISKQLGDFIQVYNKEAQLYNDQAKSASCSSLSSQCPTSSVPTPSDPKHFNSLLSTNSKDTPVSGIKTSLSAREIGSRRTPVRRSASKTLPNRRLHKSARLSPTHNLSTSSVSLLSTASLPDKPNGNESLTRFPQSSPASSKPSISSTSTVSVDYHDKLTDQTQKAPQKMLRSDPDSGVCSPGDISHSASMDLSESGVASRRKSSCQEGISQDLYRAFMTTAKETDLEEILALQTRLQNSAGIFLDPPRRAKSQRATGTTSGGRTPVVSPHGSPRRKRRPNQTPITNEPHKSDTSSAGREEPSSTVSSTPSCCVFGDILKATLQGTQST